MSLLQSNLLDLFSSRPAVTHFSDSELVCLDERGVSQFYQLLNRKAEPVLYAFDLLWLDGEDLRRLSLIERKQKLRDLIRSSGNSRLLFAGEGKRLFKEICEGPGGDRGEAEAGDLQG